MQRPPLGGRFSSVNFCVDEMASRDLSGLLNPLRQTLLALAAALALFSWVPPNHYYPWTAFHGQLSMAVAAALVATWSFASPSPAASRVPYLALVAFAAATIPWLQFASGLISFSGDALMPSLYLLAFALAQVVGFRVVAAHGFRKLLEPLAWLFVAGSLLSMWLALYQWQGLDYLFVFVMEIPPGARPLANFAQPNLLATMLVLGLIFCSYLYQIERIGKLTAALLMVLFAFGIAMTQSRAAALQLLVVGGWLALNSRRGRVNWRALALTALVVVACIMMWPHLLEASSGGGGRGIDSAASAGNRPLHWMAMLDASTRNPWFGFGWNQIPVAHYTVAPDYPATKEILADSHNLVLDLLVWNGWPIGLFLIGALGWWFLVMATRKHSPESAIALAAVISIFVHSMVEFPINYLYFMLPIAAVMGGLVAELRASDSVSAPRWAAPLSLGVLIIAGASLSLEYLKIEEEVVARRFEAARIGVDKPAFPPVDVQWLTQLGNYMRFVRTSATDNMSDADIRWMGQVAKRFPNWTAVVQYAAALARNDRPGDAAAALTRICKTHPDEACQAAQSRWSQFGKGSAKIAAVPFPAAAQR
jgi:O-antigen ligase